MSTYSQIIKPVYVTGGLAIASGVADKSTFTYGTSTENPSGGVYQDTLPTLSAGQTGVFRLTQYRGLHVNLRDSSGNELLGQQLMAASIPVVIASNQSAVAVSAASLPLPSGAATAANQTAVIGTVAAGTAAINSELIGGVFNTVLPTLTNTQQAAIQFDSSARLIISPLTNSSIVKTQLQDNAGTAIVLGQTTMSSSVPVAIASNQSAIPASQSGTWNVQPTVSSSSAITSVASSATNVTLLSSNASRKAAYFFNDSTQVLYLKFGTTASATSYTVQLAAGVFYEMPPIPCYTGQIDGIWASANGNCRITELS